MGGRETLGQSENDNNLPNQVVICATLPVICMGAPETVDRDQSFVWELGRRAGILDELLTS